ncbi:MAG: right-handed parallel beta-helix repeat-containing protein [Candidatus Celaenobacter polaris]|nr:right-handed parallel beta-helix repeat-containing protein [Candidatus Celaenobacter polaris]
MKKIMIIIGLLLLGTQALWAIVTVDGYCYLEGETNHSGTKILFEAVTPSAVTDSAYTNIDGYFLIGLSAGFYTITYSHDGRLPYTIPGDVEIFIDTTLDPVYIGLSGILSGTLVGGHNYHVVGDISVNNGDTLIIEPSVTVEFMDCYSFTIYGTLLAAGTESDSILFTSGQATPNPGDWNYIIFGSSSDSNSVISYAKIEYANYGISCSSSSPTISNNTISNNNSSGIYCYDYSSPTISNNTITNNNDDGIVCYDSSPTISNNTISNNDWGISCYNSSSPTISNNTISYTYRGISCSSSSPTISNNTISNNSYGISCGNSSPTISNNTISNNSYGISCSSSSPTISNNMILNNNSYGIFCYNSSSPTISNNAISNNYSGIQCSSSSPTISNNAISNNYRGIYCSSSSSPTISNNTINSNNNYGIMCYDNYSSPTILNNILYDNETGIHANSSPSALEYNLFWLNDYAGSGNMPAYFGQIITVNANGDSCDTYYNLFMDPLFVDPLNGDYNLSWANYPTPDLTMSPCIDAGDPNSPLDPDSTIADMGAFYFNQSVSIDEPGQSTEFNLTNYPNPLSSNVNNLTVSFNIHKPGRVTIQLFNIKGQLVSTLINEDKNVGEYTIDYQVNELSSGIYFTRMSVDGVDREVKKVILLK